MIAFVMVPDSHHAPRPRLAGSERRFDSVRITAWTYAAYCLTLWPVRVLDAAERLSNAEKIVLGALCVGCATAAVSATRRKKIGYHFCYVFSLLMLAGLPFGTVLGWNMLLALRRNRDQFWPAQRPSWMQRY